MGRTLLALDIDGVANGHCFNRDYHNGLIDDSHCILVELEPPVNRHIMEWIQFLVRHYDIDIIGISARFGSVREKKNPDYMAIAHDIEVKHISPNTGGGESRVVGLAKFMHEHPEYNKLIVLDDQTIGYDKLYNELPNVRQLHVHPRGYSGLSVNNYHTILEWVIAHCNAL